MDAFNAETNEETIHSIPALFRCPIPKFLFPIHLKLEGNLPLTLPRVRFNNSIYNHHILGASCNNPLPG